MLPGSDAFRFDFTATVCQDEEMMDRLPQMQVSDCQLKHDKYIPPAQQPEGQT